MKRMKLKSFVTLRNKSPVQYVKDSIIRMRQNGLF